MNTNSSKNVKLIKQYPFLTEVLGTRMDPYYRKEGSNDPIIDELTIRVERADGDLMFRTAKNVGLDDSSFLLSIKEDKKGQVGKQGEYAFAVGKENQIITYLNFSRYPENCGPIYASTVLWETDCFSLRPIKDISEETKYIVWVTVTAWYSDKNNDDLPGGRCGEFKHRSIRITIYGVPKQGFKNLRKESSVYFNLSLDSQMMVRGALEKNHDIVTMGGMLNEMCITFQDEVYFNGMKDILDNGEFRGASGQFGTVKVLCGEMCGYDRVMLEDSVSYISFQLRPGSKHMYVLGQQGTLPQIRNLVKTVVRMWSNPEMRKAFRPNENVSVM